ncbi:MAG: bifunctional adenosylcobinamide kinase/adenosylcobinamide-phosphate guanylyltransferase [Roseateles sp.]
MQPRVPHELILGGAKSGKSRMAESRAAAWLAAAPTHRATLIATALAGDDEMAACIRRHQNDRAARVPALETLEVPRALAPALLAHSTPQHLLVVDCLTLWLTQCLLPHDGPALDDAGWQQTQQALLDALQACPGPVVLVSNEIGLGVMPLSGQARACVNALGRLHQQVAEHCGRVTLMVAGCALAVKGGPAPC